VLAALSEAPEWTQTMSDLDVRAGGSLPRLSHAVSALERHGWVTRHPAPDNRHITLATLTEAGYAKVVASAPGHVENRPALGHRRADKTADWPSRAHLRKHPHRTQPHP
jgi:DNA-binding MarR family transcriptional regulator